MTVEGRAAWLPAAAAIVVAICIGGVVLAALGVDPLAYYGLVARRGLLDGFGVQETVARSAPLMLLGAALIASFRAGLWNLGVDGQFLLGAVMAAATATALDPVAPRWVMTLAGLAAGIAAGAAWSLPPGWLRARHGVNEVVASLMMNFLGASLTNLLIKYVFADPAIATPMTRTLPVAHRLPRLFGGTVDVGIAAAVLALAATHLALAHTAWGLRLRVLGESVRAARHAGLRVAWLRLSTFALSGGLAGLAGAVVVLGRLGSVRADYAPGYGLAVVPLVLLARLNGWAVMPLSLWLAALLIGADSAAIRLRVPQQFSLVLVGLLLGCFALAAVLSERRRRRAA